MTVEIIKTFLTREWHKSLGNYSVYGLEILLQRSLTPFLLTVYLLISFIFSISSYISNISFIFCAQFPRSISCHIPCHLTSSLFLFYNISTSIIYHITEPFSILPTPSSPPSLFQVYLPSSLLVLATWGSFVVPPDMVPARLILLVYTPIFINQNTHSKRKTQSLQSKVDPTKQHCFCALYVEPHYPPTTPAVTRNCKNFNNAPSPSPSPPWRITITPMNRWQQHFYWCSWRATPALQFLQPTQSLQLRSQPLLTNLRHCCLQPIQKKTSGFGFDENISGLVAQLPCFWDRRHHPLLPSA